MKNCPLVSIIIPTYKRPSLLKRSIVSILNQTYLNYELIIVDDNDPKTTERKETEQVVMSFANEKIIYIKHLKNLNGAVARNTGLNICKGKYVTFLDDDDEFHPKRIERLVDVMEKSTPDQGVCYTRYTKHTNKSLIKSGETISGYVYKEAISRSIYIGSGSNMFFKKTVIDHIGGFDEEFKRNQDLEYLTRSLKDYQLVFVNEDLLDIHVDIRTVKYTFEQSLKREYLYHERFLTLTESLNKKAKDSILRCFGLDLLKLHYIYKQKGYLKIIRKYRIDLMTLVRFIIYNIKRKITKRSYGFKG